MHLIYKYLLRYESELGTRVGAGEITVILTQEMDINCLRTGMWLPHICHSLFVPHSLMPLVFKWALSYFLPLVIAGACLTLLIISYLVPKRSHYIAQLL